MTLNYAHQHSEPQMTTRQTYLAIAIACGAIALVIVFAMVLQ